MSVMTNTNCVLLLGFPFSPMHLEVFQYMMLPACCKAGSYPSDSCWFEEMKGGSSRTDNPVSSHRKMKTRCVVVTVVTVALLGLILFLGLFFGLRSGSGDAHTYKRAAVATDAGQCSIIGRYPFIVP